MTTRAQLKELALLRLDEAEVLYGLGFYEGAKYIAGYAVELALKARICRMLGMEEYPVSDFGKAFAIHDLERLMKLAGLSRRLDSAGESVLGNWKEVKEWNPEQRYAPVGAVDPKDAKKVLDAIGHRKYGVLTWLKKFW